MRLAVLVTGRAWADFSAVVRAFQPLRRGAAVGLLHAAALALCAPPVAAQAPATQNAGAIQTKVTADARGPGVPDSQVSCRAQRNDDRPSLRCTFRFETPIDVTRGTVVDAGNKSLEWTPVFHPFDPTEDDTAFYILIDRRTARQAEMRDLSEVFARARGRQQIAVSTFANDLTRLQPFTTDRAAVSNAFSRISPGGSASELLRHALEAIRQLQSVSAPQKVLLIASSGKSDDTAYTIEDVIKLAQLANVRIVALGYVDQSADTPNLQILERMSNSTGGFYYRSDIRKPLPQDIRTTILTRHSTGGTLDATAPTKDLPASVEVTLRHPANLTSAYTVNFIAAGQPAVGETKKPVNDEGSLAGLWAKFSSNPLVSAAVGLLVLLIVGAIFMLAKQSRHRSRIEPPEMPLSSAPLASAEEVRENLSAQREAIGLGEPNVPPAKLPTDPGGSRVFETAERPQPVPVAEAPIIAWLEFNSTPGRVAVRKQYVTIGREADNDVITDPNDLTVSRNHAVISVNNNGRFQISNRSTERRAEPNPILINDKEMERGELSDGDRVKLGTGNCGFVFVQIR
jgi:hypothetical protein